MKVILQECQECQRRNQPQPAQQAPLETFTSNYPFEKLSWDIMGPLPVTSNGNKYIVVITDIFSKWVEAFPILGLRHIFTVIKVQTLLVISWQQCVIY